jgi:hypothetical protein
MKQNIQEMIIPQVNKTVEEVLNAESVDYNEPFANFIRGKVNNGMTLEEVVAELIAVQNETIKQKA